MSLFSSPRILALLKEKFIPVAFDQFYQRQQKDPEGDFYRKIAGQGPRNDFSDTTQGHYVADAEGKLLGYHNHRSPELLEKLLLKALETSKGIPVEPLDKDFKADSRFRRELPEGGLKVRTHTRVLGGYAPTENPMRKIFQSSTGRDNLWLTPTEHEELRRGLISDTLAQRIARFHLVDNTRGEPTFWAEREVQLIELSLKDGLLSGNFSLESTDGKRGFVGTLYGRILANTGGVSQFDIVALGSAWGHGRYTRGAPKNRFPLAVAFRLADGSDLSDSVPPQGTKGWQDRYIRF